ncbi:hypothetical protein D9M70_648700 [compost metagenome]
MRRVEQAVGVVLEAEDGGADLGAVGAHALEDRQAIVQGVRQDVRRRVSPRDELAVIPDETVAVSHRHGVLPYRACAARGVAIAARPAGKAQES